MNKINIPDNFNFFNDEIIYFKEHDDLLWNKIFKFKKNTNSINKLKNLGKVDLTTDIMSSKYIHFFPFKKFEVKSIKENKLILSVNSDSEKINIQTGNYAGIIYLNDFKFEIHSRFGNSFLQRMLNFLNNIYLDDINPISSLKKKDFNQFQFIISYLFLQALDKASIMGLPQTYITKQEHSYKFKGSADINEFIKKDVPFQGKISSKHREMQVVPEIATVLSKALLLIRTNYSNAINNKLEKFTREINSNSTKHYVNSDYLIKTLNNKSLNNPIFDSYKKVLKYADIIINNYELSESFDSKNKATTGFLFDISELFEIYLEKLLRLKLKDYKVYPQMEINAYNKKFYSRKMLPDLILKNIEKNQLLVFDAKYKKMRGIGKDIDRFDFYQIHTYMSYFNNDVLLGGLLYPYDENSNMIKTHGIDNSWFFGQKNRKPYFIIDGIKIKEKNDNAEMSIKEIINSETEFINRLSNFINLAQIK